MSLKLSELKNLHAKGLSLIYLHEKEKRPIGNDWSKLKNKSWEEMEASFEKRYNVGVRLGTHSKLVSGLYLGAIDCDVKSKSRKAIKEMNDKLRELGIDLNEAPIVISGRGNGSKHIYVQTKTPMVPMKYAQSEHLTKVKMNLNKPHTKREMEMLNEEERAQGYRIRPSWEIAFMGEGQQTVLPPSIHPDTGFAYAWANPLMVKYLPTFKPEKFVSQTTKKLDERELDFKAKDVDLYDSKLPIRIIVGMETGKGVEDRSAFLFTASLTMCRIGFSDNEILSVLSDPDLWISSAAYEHTQSQSRARAVKWLHKYTLTKARHETDVARKFENKPDLTPMGDDEAKALAEMLDDKSGGGLPDSDGKGKPKPTLRNIVRILEKMLGDKKGGLVGFDEFSNRVYFLKDTEYGGKKGQELTDVVDLQLKNYIADHYRFEPSKDLCYEAHTLIAMRYKYHPVRDYLNSLKWDGVARLDGWLAAAFGARGPDDYVRAVARKTLTAAVSRIFEPGCKFDHALVLEGFQGKGKSTALNILASDKWFTDGLGDIHTKDVVDQMTGKWIVELGELASIKKSEIEATKAFLTRRVDRVRPPYGRRSTDFPRQSIFMGSTNQDEYLTDETGNRRFWPVKISPEKVNFKWLHKHRDQIWAEAMICYELGEPLYLNDEIEEIARGEQSKRFAIDEWEMAIKKIIVKLKTDGKRTGEQVSVTSTQLFCELQGMPDGMAHPQLADSIRIGKVMARLGHQRKTVRFGEITTKGWKL